jgi:putative copper export protein
VTADLAPAVDGVRLTIHVLAATVWVGGQLTVAGLLPTLRQLGDDAPRRVARAFGRLMWPSYGVLVATGIWNVAASHPSQRSTPWDVVLGVKIAVVAAAGLAALLHQRATSRGAIAAWGAVAGVTSLGALALGVFLAG